MLEADVGHDAEAALQEIEKRDYNMSRIKRNNH